MHKTPLRWAAGLALLGSALLAQPALAQAVIKVEQPVAKVATP